jgi:hypothetical protein
MTTWINSQFPRPDFHRQVQRHYGLHNKLRPKLPRLTSTLPICYGMAFWHSVDRKVGRYGGDLKLPDADRSRIVAALEAVVPRPDETALARARELAAKLEAHLCGRK